MRMLYYFYTLLFDKHTRVNKNRSTSELLHDDDMYSNVTQITNTINTGIFKTDYPDHYSILCVTYLVISTQKTKFANKHDLSQNISFLMKLLINIIRTNYLLIHIHLSFSKEILWMFMNIFLTINISVDMLTPTIKLMKIHRNV